MNSLKEKRLKQWQAARFGMFIHWGLYTVDGHDCAKMSQMGIPVREYIERLEPRFNPRKFDADALADLAVRAGCKYVVMGSRHHEGYCLWNTRTTRFSSAHMTPQRDFIAEYVKAVRARGLMVGLYYSLLDWRYQCYFDGPWANPKKWKVLVNLVHAQVRELMTHYGKINILWYDGGWMNHANPAVAHATGEEIAKFWKSKKLNAMVQKLQPGILVNNRSYPRSGGDFGTPEQQISPEARPWELCDTPGHFWGADPRDLNRKTPREILMRLITCVSRNGNMLLNIGPNADGSIQKWQAVIMEQIGCWIKKHGEAIYGCGRESGMPFCWNSLWITTRKGNTLYLHLFCYPGCEFSIANLHNYHLKSATVLDTGQRLKIRHEPTRDIISGLPQKAPDPIATVVKVAVRPKTAAESKQRQGIALEDPENEICYDR